MIKVVSGWGGPGGSTVAFSNLVNLFNRKGRAACLYTPTKWEGVTCKWDSHQNIKFNKDDKLIYHFMNFTKRPPVSKIILSCHETRVFPIKSNKDLVYDDIHFVSSFQKEWQDVDGQVIPNVLHKYLPRHNKFKVTCAGVLGSIDTNKRTHLSIERALDDGHNDVRLYGAITDHEYFNREVMPLLGEKVSYRGIASDMQAVYDSISDVYHSPELETFNLIRPECAHAEVNYHGYEGNDTKAEEWDDDKIFKAWKKLLK